MNYRNAWTFHQCHHCSAGHPRDRICKGSYFIIVSEFSKCEMFVFTSGQAGFLVCTFHLPCETNTDLE